MRGSACGHRSDWDYGLGGPVFYRLVVMGWRAVCALLACLLSLSLYLAFILCAKHNQSFTRARLSLSRHARRWTLGAFRLHEDDGDHDHYEVKQPNHCKVLMYRSNESEFVCSRCVLQIVRTEPPREQNIHSRFPVPLPLPTASHYALMLPVILLTPTTTAPSTVSTDMAPLKLHNPALFSLLTVAPVNINTCLSLAAL